MASGMSWLGWHRSNLSLRQGTMNMNNPKVVLLGRQPYLPGDRIQGKASWGFRNNVSVKDTKLSVHGACKVKWIVGFGENKMVFESDEAYFDTAVFNDSNTEENLLKASEHEIEFDFTLPRNIPSSFQSKDGNVSYIVSLTVLYSDGRLTFKETFDSAFLVKNPYEYRGPEAPIVLSAAEDYGLCGKRNVIEFDISTNKNNYSPGECISINGFIDNRSKKKLSCVKLILTQRITYTVSSELSQHQETRTKSNIVGTWLSGEVRSGTKMTFDNQETMRVPDVVESELRNCEAIKTEYTLKFGVKLPGLLSREVYSDSEVVFIGNNQTGINSPETESIAKRQVYVLMKNGSFMRL